MGLSIAPAIRFEAAFASVRKTVEGTPAQLDRIRTGILDMSREMPLAATSIAEVAATAGQLGVATPDVLAFTRTMIQLGTATDLTANQASIAMARFANIMEIPVKEIPKLAAALVHLGNNSATTESEILTLGLRLAAAGDQLGLSGQQVFALSAAMRSLGITAEVGGSSMSRVIIDMVSAVGGGNVAKVEAFAKVIGVTRDEFETMVRSRSPEAAGKLLLGFVEGLQRVDESGGNVRGVLAELGLDSIRLRQVLLGLVAGGDQLASSFALVGDEAVYGGALLQEYGRFAETTAARLEVLKNRLTALAIDIGTPTLGGIVAILDGIGDAVVSMQDALRPLGTSLAELFGNVAEAVNILFDALGKPVVLTAAAALAGLANVVANLLGLFNALGSTGVIALGLIAADIALVGPLSVVATSGLAGLSAGFLSMGASASIGTAAIELFQAAIAASPLIVFVAALALFGKAMIDAGRAAEEAGDAYRNRFQKALEDSDWRSTQTAISDVRKELEQLREVNSIDSARDLASWRGLGQAIKGVGEVLTPFTENTVLNARERIDELNKVLEENHAEALTMGITQLSESLGISESAAYSAAIATGTLQGLMSDVDGYQKARIAIGAYIAVLEASGATSGRTAEAIIETGLTIEDYGAIWDASATTVEAAAKRAGISADDLLDSQKFEENTAAMEPYIGLWANIAEVIGSSTDAVREEIEATEGLIYVQNELAKAIEGVAKAREAAKFQIENLEAAAEAAAKAKDEFRDGAISLEEYGQKVGELNAALAASGAPMEAVSAAQRNLVNDFVQTAAGAGELQGAINGVLVDWVLLSSTEAANLQLKGQETLVLAQERIANLREELRLPIIAQIAAETGRTEEQIIALLDRGNTWANSLFEAKMDAEVETAFEAIRRIMVEAGIWDETEADAIMGALIDGGMEDIGTIKSTAEQYRAGDYTASIRASDAASGVIAVPQDSANRYRAGDYTASIRASDAASGVIAVPQANADRYRAGNYNASITASDNASRTIAIPQGNANSFRDKSPYGITLSATDNASGTIWGAIRALSGFVSKSITLSTNVVTNYSSTGSRPTGNANNFGAADGAVLRSYAGGGIENHTAMIANGRWPVRIWAEPETQGEAYIPLAQSKRPRSMAILADVANRFGYGLMPMAGGGLIGPDLAVWAQAFETMSGGSRTVWSSSVTIDAPINVSIDGGAAGLDPQMVATAVERGVQRALVAAGRDISRNIRGA